MALNKMAFNQMALNNLQAMNESQLFDYLCVELDPPYNGCEGATNLSSLYEDIDVTEIPLDGMTWQIIPTFYLLLLILGLPGNTLVVYVVLRHGPMKTVTNLFLMNLALSDLLFLCVCAPYFISTFITHDWPFGSAMCKFIFIKINPAANETITCIFFVLLNMI